MQPHFDTATDTAATDTATDTDTAATDTATDTAADSATFWEDFYSRADPRWGTRVNVVLEGLVTAFAQTPGTALDLGCGHGGDALWLAGAGWDVTAADVAQAALDRVAESAWAASLAGRVHPVRHDLAESFPEGEFDLVSATYFQTPIEIPRTEVLRRAAHAVAPNGLLIVVEHASVPPWSWQAGQDIRFPTPEEVLASLELGAGWRVERCDAPEREATGPEGQSAMVVENVIVVRRIA
ncbi:class I SAM-dependent methyltransferase [Catenulispora pinisilvae]|uniref:class I SAM-dependent methyltransferase n=1 Tax=Catenulispora pinisilvae TaxID=2705253 RepID=UPI0018927886|nr:methyltransferase domain-containing protein [Catenulispora pinisilvae]